MATNLTFYKLKDTTAASCEHCGLCHDRTEQIEGLGDFTARFFCDECVQAEDRIEAVNALIRKTVREIETIPPTKTEALAQCRELLARQKLKRQAVIDTARNVLNGRKQGEKTRPRMPYKE